MANGLPGAYFLPRLIKFARERAGLTQRDLAKACEVVQPAVVAWESGRRAISEETLGKVARALGHPEIEPFVCLEVTEWIAATGIKPRRKEKKPPCGRPLTRTRSTGAIS